MNLNIGPFDQKITVQINFQPLPRCRIYNKMTERNRLIKLIQLCFSKCTQIESLHEEEVGVDGWDNKRPDLNTGAKRFECNVASVYLCLDP